MVRGLSAFTDTAVRVENRVKNVSHRQLTETLSYNSLTGKFRRLKRTTTWVKVGEQPGFINGHGYWEIGINGDHYLASRLAWFYVHKKWPKFIDHINGIRLDNRISNLRSVTHLENNKNKKINRNHSIGAKGVIRLKKYPKFRARIMVDNKPIHLGYFDSVAAAHEAYCRASAKYHGKYGRTH